MIFSCVIFFTFFCVFQFIIWFWVVSPTIIYSVHQGLLFNTSRQEFWVVKTFWCSSTLSKHHLTHNKSVLAYRDICFVSNITTSFDLIQANRRNNLYLVFLMFHIINGMPVKWNAYSYRDVQLTNSCYTCKNCVFIQALVKW